MKLFNLLTIILFVSFTLACTKQKRVSEENNTTNTIEEEAAISPTNNEGEPKTYVSDLLGWEFSVPAGWKVVESTMTIKSENNVEGNGSNTELDTTIQRLISIQKDELNVMAVTVEPFTAMYEGEFEQNTKMINDLIYNTFTSQGIPVDSASGHAAIGGKLFNQFTNTIYTPQGNIFMTQTLMNALVNGYDLAINMGYNSEESGKEIMDAIQQSTFQ